MEDESLNYHAEVIEGGVLLNRRQFLLSSLAVLASVTVAPSLLMASESPLGQRLLSQGMTGPDVTRLQQLLKVMGYLHENPSGYFGPSTYKAVSQFQADRKLSVDGVVGPATIQALRPQLLNWFGTVDKLLPIGAIVRVTDPVSGLSYHVKRTGGYNHADVEPLTPWDASVQKRIYGGSWNWARKPVIVTIKGWRIAGSINGMPHSYDTISGNDFPGHSCIHFLNSRTHGSNCVDPEHQAAIFKASAFQP